jgi:hypothetical protein
MSLKFVLNPGKYIQLASGQKTASGYDLVRDKTQTDGYSRPTWVKIGGGAYKGPPAKLYEATDRDEICFAYNQLNNEILAYWNVTQKQGSSTNILRGIFNAPFLILLGLALMYYFWFRNEENGVTAATKMWIDLGAVVMVAAGFIYGLMDWRASRTAQSKLNELLKQRGYKK